MRSAHSALAVQPEGRCRIFRRSNALQFVSRPPSVRALLVKDRHGHDASVDDKFVRGIVDRLYRLPDTKLVPALFHGATDDPSRRFSKPTAAWSSTALRPSPARKAGRARQGRGVMARPRLSAHNGRAGQGGRVRCIAAPLAHIAAQCCRRYDLHFVFAL